jgi:hypothetical protein
MGVVLGVDDEQGSVDSVRMRIIHGTGRMGWMHVMVGGDDVALPAHLG